MGLHTGAPTSTEPEALKSVRTPPFLAHHSVVAQRRSASSVGSSTGRMLVRSQPVRGSFLPGSRSPESAALSAATSRSEMSASDETAKPNPTRKFGRLFPWKPQYRVCGHARRPHGQIPPHPHPHPRRALRQTDPGLPAGRSGAGRDGATTTPAGRVGVLHPPHYGCCAFGNERNRTGTERVTAAALARFTF